MPRQSGHQPRLIGSGQIGLWTAVDAQGLIRAVDQATDL